MGETTYLSAAETAKLLRQDLKRWIPERGEWAALILDDCGEAEPKVERALMAGRALTGALDLLSGPELRRVRDELRNERWMSAHIIAGIRDYVDDHQRRP